MNIRIVSDSTCDLPVSLVHQHKLTIVPCYINFGEKSFLDTIDITRADFYHRAAETKEIPKTSAPSVGRFAEIYDRLADEGAQAIISIHIRKGLSNLANAAHLAARTFKRARVHVVEVGQVAISLGYMVVQAAQGVGEGKSINDIIAHLAEINQRSYLFAALDSLAFLKHSGRVPSLLVGLADLFHVKPVLLLRQGTVSIVDRVRTASKQNEVLIKLARQQLPLEWIGVTHTHAADRARQFAESIKSVFNLKKEIWIEEATPILGVHVGPGALGIACVRSAIPSSY